MPKPTDLALEIKRREKIMKVIFVIVSLYAVIKELRNRRKQKAILSVQGLQYDVIANGT